MRLRKHLLLLAAGRVKLILRCIKAAAARLWQGLGWADLGWIKCPKRERPVIHNERPDPHPVIQLYFAKHKICQLMRFNCNFKVVVMELFHIQCIQTSVPISVPSKLKLFREAII